MSLKLFFSLSLRKIEPGKKDFNLIKSKKKGRLRKFHSPDFLKLF